MMYQNFYNPYLMQNNPQGLIRVNGVEGAKAYQLGAGQTIALFDSGSDVFYVKSCDNAGFPTIRVFKFEEVDVSTKKVDVSTNYVSREEMEEYVKHIIQSITGADATDKSTADAND